MKRAISNNRPFPDFVTKIEDMVVDEDKIAIRTLDSGTQKIQNRNNPSTDKKVQWARYIIFHLKNGRITNAWNLVDLLSMYQQLGALPPTEEIGK